MIYKGFFVARTQAERAPPTAHAPTRPHGGAGEANGR